MYIKYIYLSLYIYKEYLSKTESFFCTLETNTTL